MSRKLGGFDRFADASERVVSSARFFTICVLLVVVWAPSYFLFGNLDTWQLVINTATTIITFLLVALLQNNQARFEDATNARLQEIIDKIDAARDPVSDPGNTVDS